MKRVPARDFQDLIVWQKAHQFVLSVYKVSERFPKNEMFALTSQLRRAAVSIPANITEGFKRKTNLDKARYMNIAQASLEECRYYLILSKDLGYCEGYRIDRATRRGKQAASKLYIFNSSFCLLNS